MLEEITILLCSLIAMISVVLKLVLMQSLRVLSCGKTKHLFNNIIDSHSKKDYWGKRTGVENNLEYARKKTSEMDSGMLTPFVHSVKSQDKDYT